MKVFADNHHGDLFYSLYRLFEERFGWELYRPIGLDWFHEGYWKIAEPYNNAQDTINQYLEINNQGWQQYKYLNGDHYFKDGIYYIYDGAHDYYHRAITLKQFKTMKFDIIMPTYQPHDAPYSDLQKKYQPQAKLVAQMGNTGQKTFIRNILHSVPYIPDQGQKTVFYHQELDTRYFSYIPPNPSKKIFSMVNCLPYSSLYHTYRDALSEVDMRAYGADCPNGALSGSNSVAKYMKLANIGWHLKPLGGLGHSAMGWFACGRPTITNMSQHRNWGGEALALFEPGVTCHDIEAHSFNENLKLIRRMLEPEENIVWCERARARFNDIINYEKEAEEIKRFFLENVLS